MVQPGPHMKVDKERSGANAVAQEKVGEQSPAASGFRVSSEVEKKEFEIAEQGSKWQPVPKKKAATNNFMASYGRSCENGCEHDGGYWSDFTRWVPSW